ncbi:MAG TPA: acyl-CoA dehydrogenase family protein [Conexibacter sp.]|jgi:alkylation response protein AidB-like acyl-CoA dehydrogenase|nr:acyl-CoA dehydrogenase family protein [Conexibacter sp.]
MHFDLTEDQKEIKRVAHELLAARSSWERVRAAAEGAEYDQALWDELCSLGWPGIAVAEEHGGQGLGAVELAVLLEELGYACAASPFLSIATAAAAIQACGSDAQRARWLPALASGEATAGIGTRELCADGVGAAVLVLLDGDGVRLLDAADADAAPLETIDPTRRYATIAAEAGAGEPLGGGAAGGSAGRARAAGPSGATDPAADRIRAAIAAEVVGVAQRALELTLAYVKERRQFGVPVGAFQAVQNRCAQMLLDTESARSTALYAAWAADAAPERVPEAAALAAAAAADAGRSVTASAIQAHGGIGFTWEADVHWLYKRAQLDAALLGGARRHRAALTALAAERIAAGRTTH